MEKVSKLLVSFIAVYLAVYSVALISAARNEWFGVSDFRPLAFWTIPLALAVGFLNLILFGVYTRQTSTRKYLLAIGVGVGLGIECVFFTVLCLGPWMGAFSVPVLPCWLLGGVAGSLSIALWDERWKSWFLQIGLVLIVGSGIVLVILPAIAAKITHSQTLQLSVLKWTAPETPLKIGNIAAWDIRPAGVEMLKRNGIKGTLAQWDNLGNFSPNRDPDAQMVVLLQNRPTEMVLLEEPDHCLIIYLQEGKTWRKIPADAPMLKSKISLIPSETDPLNQTDCWMDISGGGRQGSVLYEPNDDFDKDHAIVSPFLKRGK